MRKGKWCIWAIALLLLPWSVLAAEVPGTPGSLNTARLDSLLKTLMPAIEGQPGRWEVVLEGVPVLIISQDAYNRLRVLAPVARLEESEDP